MKEKLLSLKLTGGGRSNKLKRQGSSQSLAIEEGRAGERDLTRRGSVTSLKSLGILSSPFKTGGSGKKREEACEDEEDDGFDSKEGRSSMRKRFSRRLSSLFDSPSKLGGTAESRRHSLSTVSLSSSIGAQGLPTSLGAQGKLSEAQLLQLAEEPDSEAASVRHVLRRDLPLCWLDQTQVRPTRPPRQEPNMDILTRLYCRPFTRHLARLVLSLLELGDLHTMSSVSRGWDKMIRQELEGSLACGSKCQDRGWDKIIRNELLGSPETGTI